MFMKGKIHKNSGYETLEEDDFSFWGGGDVVQVW